MAEFLVRQTVDEIPVFHLLAVWFGPSYFSVSNLRFFNFMMAESITVERIHSIKQENEYKMARTVPETVCDY